MAEDERVEGEAGVIEAFMAPLAAGFAGALGLKDDCALLSPPAGEDLVLKTDAVAEGVHFLPDDDAADIGWKALAVNLSDLAAKGARPIAYLMSLSFPESPRRAWMAGFAAGLAEAQARFGVQLAGGDTDRRPGPLSITIAIIGAVPAGRMVRRAAARPGQRLLVSGTLGDAALGLRLALQPQLAARWGSSAAEVAELLGRYRRPQPRLALRQALLGHAAAAMDLSDGLAKDLGRMVAASGVAARVRLDALPLTGATRRAVTAEPAARGAIVAGGDDYEVLAAVEPGEVAAYMAAARAAGVPVAEIGEIHAGASVRILDEDGHDVVLDKTGWDHFG